MPVLAVDWLMLMCCEDNQSECQNLSISPPEDQSVSIIETVFPLRQKQCCTCLESVGRLRCEIDVSDLNGIYPKPKM